MILGTIYIIRNKVNNKVYIGQTIQDFNKRFSDHLYNAYKEQRQTTLYHAIRKYGASNFYIEVLESDIPKEILTDKEEYYIRQFDSVNSGYNMKYRTEDPRFTTIYSLTDEEFIYLYNSNTVTDLAKELNLSRTVIINRAKRLNLPKKPTGLNKSHIKNKNLFTKDLLNDLYINQNKTTQEIADLYNVSYTVVKNQLRCFGIYKISRRGVEEQSSNENDVNLDIGCADNNQC